MTAMLYWTKYGIVILKCFLGEREKKKLFLMNLFKRTLVIAQSIEIC